MDNKEKPMNNDGTPEVAKVTFEYARGVGDKTAFQSKLEHLINCESLENESDTPAYILAKYLTACLDAFTESSNARDKWFGRNVGG